tara:strand:+ start:10122 stop:10826 length:705 start_codon:yes stop_codon:yes gene_type:complete
VPASESGYYVFMSRITVIVLILTSILIFFNKKIVSYYYINKFSNWVERPVKIKRLNFNYSGYVKIEDIEILNYDKNYYKNIFKAEKIEISFDMNSIFSDLILIKSLDIYDPEFFLDIDIKKDNQNTDNKIFYEDNIGLAKKINEKTPDKIWPKKNKDINFLINKSNLYGGVGYIKVPQILNPSKVKLSQMRFSSFGNDKNYRHYKDVLNSILFDLYARTDEIELKQLLKEIYKF